MLCNIFKIFKLMGSKVHSIIANRDGRDAHPMHADLGCARQVGRASTLVWHPNKSHSRGFKVLSSITNRTENGPG